jgi:hypothetical protein
MQTLGPRIGLASLAIQQRQPEIFLVAGIGAGVASAVMLAKAHNKSEETFDEVFDGIEAVRDFVAVNNNAAGDVPSDWHEITPAEERKLLLPLYMMAGQRAIILYGPSVLMGVASIAFLLASHSNLQRRNRALISAVALIERGFAQYRKRVVDEIGADADTRFYYGAEARARTTVEIGPDGKKKKRKTTENHIPEKVSPMIYQRIFDETNKNWSNMDDMNEFFLKATERSFNDRLTIKGWLTLNSVYEALGFEASPEGAVVGWSKNVPGDGFVSFGIDHDINMREGDFRFLLDFNVHGVILNNIGTSRTDTELTMVNLGAG